MGLYEEDRILILKNLYEFKGYGMELRDWWISDKRMEPDYF